MGGSNYSKTVNKLTQKNLIDASSRIVSENLNYIENNSNTAQDIFLQFTDSEINCPININQVQTVVAEVISQFTAEQTSDLKKTIDAELVSALKNATEQTNEGIGFGQSNTSVTENTQTFISRTDASTEILQNTANDIEQIINASQNIKFIVENSTINCEGGTIDIRQNMNVKNTINNVVNSTQFNTIATDIETRTNLSTDNQTTQKNSGLLAFGPLFAALGGIISALGALMAGLLGFKILMYALKFGAAREEKKVKQTEQQTSLIQSTMKVVNEKLTAPANPPPAAPKKKGWFRN